MTSRKIHLRLSRLPSGLASYPRVVLTRRPDVLTVEDPPEIEIRVPRVRFAAASIARYSTTCGFDGGDVRNGYVPITYPHVLAMPLHLRIMAMGSFALRPMGLIHLSNSIAAPGELRPGMSVDLVVAARNYRKTDAGLAFDMDTEMTGSDGAPVWRETCVFMSRWPESVQRSGGRPARPPKAPKDSEVLTELPVNLRTAWRYARVSGDFNPIHLNDRAARFFGLRGAIMHGMWSLARSLGEKPVHAPARDARLETQFLTPVQLPARVNVKQWTEAGAPRRAMCDVRTGRVHMFAHWTNEGPAAA
ncbi:MAG TPA: MaoC/PaaZ C-terminal domain-containing protein [Steroidobacteraceae bacterium]|nr:MaoC/PaaZ C-terminal domain-containing protein [Steroidobacteraceae bacterium]